MHTAQRISIANVPAKAPLSVSDIQWDALQRKIAVGRRMIKFTPCEYRLLTPLRDGQPITYAQLAMAAYGYKLDYRVREMMDRHIDRIRGKMEGSGVYIYSVRGYGYMLLPTVALEESALYAS